MNFGIYCHTNFVEFWNVAFEKCVPKQCVLFLYKYFWKYMVHIMCCGGKMIHNHQLFGQFY